MKPRLCVIRVRNVRSPRRDGIYDVGILSARMTDRRDNAYIAKVFNKPESAFYFGGKSYDFYRIAARFVVLTYSKGCAPTCLGEINGPSR